MTKAEIAAYEKYPKKGGIVTTSFGKIEVDNNADLRKGFIEGYEQALKDALQSEEKDQGVKGYVLESCSPCCIDEMPTQRCIKLLYEEDDTNFVQAGDHVKVKIEKQ